MRHGGAGGDAEDNPQHIRPECLVLIETTVAPGTTEFAAWPILKRLSPIAASPRCRCSLTIPRTGHAGPRYVASIRDFWRVCAGW